MKKFTLAFGVFVGTFFAANAQCTIDPSAIPAGLFADTAALPCVEQGVAYDQTRQFKIPGTIDASQFGSPIPFNVTVDSVWVDSVATVDPGALPQGLTASWNPASGVFPGGSNGCFNISGTTNDPVGHYPVTVYGWVHVSGLPTQFVPSGDTTVPLSMLSQMGGGQAGQSPLDFSVDVIEQGAECRPQLSGIATHNLNAVIKAYPNPTKNVLNVDINAVERINGTISIIDVMGRVVYSEKVDYVGKVMKSIPVAALGSGIYSLQITNAKNSFKTKFTIE